MPVKRYDIQPLEIPRRLHLRARPAQQQLLVAHTTLQGIFDSLHLVRTAASEAPGGSARGRLREGEVDLLRSAIVLAGAGVDAVLKRLVTDALPTLLESPARHPLATKKYKEHVGRQFRKEGASKSWIDAVLSDDPRPQMVQLYVEHLVTGSLQNETDLKRVRDALGIEPDELPDDRIARMQGFLTARNQVAHDLDLKRPDDETRGNRYTRRVPTVISQCDDAIDLTRTYVCLTSELLKRRRALGPTKLQSPGTEH